MITININPHICNHVYHVALLIAISQISALDSCAAENGHWEVAGAKIQKCFSFDKDTPPTAGIKTNFLSEFTDKNRSD